MNERFRKRTITIDVWEMTDDMTNEEIQRKLKDLRIELFDTLNEFLDDSEWDFDLSIWKRGD